MIPSTSETWRRVWASPSLGMSGHPGIHLHQHQLALLQHLPAQGRAPQGAAHPPVLVRQRAGQRRHPGAPGQEPGRSLAQVGGGVMDVAHGLQAPLHAVEVGVIGDLSRQLRRQQPGPGGNEVPVDVHVTAGFQQPLRQGAVQLPGPVGHGRKSHLLAVPDQLRRLPGGHPQGLVLGLPVSHAGAAAPAGGCQCCHGILLCRPGRAACSASIQYLLYRRTVPGTILFLSG